MATTEQYLNQLQSDKQTLVENLKSKGIEATNEETFTTLVPKVSEIETGGGDISDYLPSTVPAGTTRSTYSYYHSYIKKIPKFSLSDIQGFYTNVSGLFAHYYNLTDIDLSGLNTSGITKMTEMFYYCKSLTTINLSSFNTSSVTTMDKMFSICERLTDLDLSSFDLSNVTRIYDLFYSCISLVNLIFGNNLGKGYTQKTANYSYYTLSLASSQKTITYESLMDVINKLYDLNLTYDVANGGTLYTQKLVLGSTNIAKLTAEEIAIATNKGWTVS